MDWIAEKFESKNRFMDLHSFIADKTRKDFLRPTLYLPEGDTRAIRTLKGLIAKYSG